MVNDPVCPIINSHLAYSYVYSMNERARMLKKRLVRMWTAGFTYSLGAVFIPLFLRIYYY